MLVNTLGKMISALAEQVIKFIQKQIQDYAYKTYTCSSNSILSEFNQSPNILVVYMLIIIIINVNIKVSRLFFEILFSQIRICFTTNYFIAQHCISTPTIYIQRITDTMTCSTVRCIDSTDSFFFKFKSTQAFN